MSRKEQPKKDTQPRWFRTMGWIIVGWGVVSLLLTLFGLFPRSPKAYVSPFYFIFFGTSYLVRPARPRLANVCLALAGVAVIVSAVLLATSWGTL